MMLGCSALLLTFLRLCCALLVLCRVNKAPQLACCAAGWGLRVSKATTMQLHKLVTRSAERRTSQIQLRLLAQSQHEVETLPVPASQGSSNCKGECGCSPFLFCVLYCLFLLR